MKRLAVFLALLLVMSACKVRVELDTTIEADGSGRVAFSVGFDEEFRQSLETFSQLGDESSPDFFEEIEGDAPEGWDVERFSDGEIEGVRISREFSDLDDLRTALEETEGFGESGEELGGDSGSPALSEDFSVERDGDIITIELGSPDTGFGDTGGGEDVFGGENPFEDLEFEIVVRFTLPGEIQEHTADEVDGNTLVWRFDQTSEPTPIRAVSDASKAGSSDGSDFPIALVVGLAVLVAGAVGLFLWNQNRQKPAVAGGPPPAGGGAPPAPGSEPPSSAPPAPGSDAPPSAPPPPPPPD